MSWFWRVMHWLQKKEKEAGCPGISTPLSCELPTDRTRELLRDSQIKLTRVPRVPVFGTRVLGCLFAVFPQLYS